MPLNLLTLQKGFGRILRIIFDKVMQTKDVITKEGKVTETLMGGMFKVVLDETAEEVLAALCGKMRKFRIRILPGDKVKVEFSPHDLKRGRISFRCR